MTGVIPAAVVFVTHQPETYYECAETNGSLKYANGDLIAKYCSVCESLQRNRCLRAKPEAQAAKVFAWIEETTLALEQARHYSRRLSRMFKKCSACYRLAPPGYVTCELHHQSTEKDPPAPHKCSTHGCTRKTLAKRCKTCAAKRREARKRKEKA